MAHCNTPEDRDHFQAVCSAFFNYQVDSMLDILHMDLSSQTELLRSAVYTNSCFLSRCVHVYRSLFSYKKLPNGSYLIANLRVSQRDVRQVRAVLKQCARDWSDEGVEEREETFTIVLEEVQRHFPRPRLSSGDQVKVLTPGAGLARLSYEFARLGYSSQGTEASYFHLLISDFLLNKSKRRNEYRLSPYLHSANSQATDSLEQVCVPDVCPANELSTQDDLSMVAGDFVRVYQAQESEWDCVVTCYSSGWGSNVLLYVETIWNCLKSGGIWIHFSPIRYHVTDRRTNSSVDVTFSDTRQAIMAKGFQILKEETKDSRCTQEKWILQVACKRYVKKG